MLSTERQIVLLRVRRKYVIALLKTLKFEKTLRLKKGSNF